MNLHPQNLRSYQKKGTRFLTDQRKENKPEASGLIEMVQALERDEYVLIGPLP